MGERRVTELWPKQVQTVGLMLDLGALVCAFCPKCRNIFKIDLEAIIWKRGRSYSLIDQQGPCRLRDCDGRAFFMWSPGLNVPYRKLASNRGDQARIAASNRPPDDDPDPSPPRTPLGVDTQAWAAARSDGERRRLIRIPRG